MIKMEKGPTLNDRDWHHVEVSQQRKVCYCLPTCEILIQIIHVMALRPVSTQANFPTDMNVPS